MVSDNLECTARCERFICERKPPALRMRKQSGRKIVWCTWIDEECDQGWCVHSKCAIRKLSQDGKCQRAQVIASVQTEVRIRNDEPYPDAMPKDIAKRFRQR